MPGIRTWHLTALALALTVGCGGDDKTAAVEGCQDLVTHLSKAWERCQIHDPGGKLSDYEYAHDNWATAFDCDHTAKSYDQAALRQCLADVDAEACGSVRGLPSSCVGVISK